MFLLVVLVQFGFPETYVISGEPHFQEAWDEILEVVAAIPSTYSMRRRRASLMVMRLYSERVGPLRCCVSVHICFESRCEVVPWACALRSAVATRAPDGHTFALV